jgi:hypothetical protein
LKPGFFNTFAEAPRDRGLKISFRRTVPLDGWYYSLNGISYSSEANAPVVSYYYLPSARRLMIAIGRNLF